MTVHDLHYLPEEPLRVSGGQLRDPVCGMTVDEVHAAARTEWEGKTYLFCTTACQDRFEREPLRFVGQRSQGGEEPWD